MIRRLVFAALGRTVYRRLWLFELDLHDTRQANHQRPLDCGFLDAADLRTYAEFRPPSEASALERFRRGDRCFVVRDRGEIVFGRWVASGTAPIEYLARTLPLAPDEAYAYDGYTEPRQRGHGLATAATLELGNLLAAEGIRRLLASAWPENRAAVRWHEKAGEHRIATVGYVRLGPWRRDFIRRRA